MQLRCAQKFTKLLMSAAVVGAFSSSAMAQSSVKIEGLVDVFAASMEMSGDASSVVKLDSGGMSTSYLGFSGMRTFGTSGLTGGFNLGAFIRPSTGSSGRFNGDGLFTRDANAYVKGSFGGLLVGRAKAPNLLPTILFNAFGDSFQFSPLIVGLNIGSASWSSTVAGDTGWSNQITYTTPSIAGMTGNLFYQPGGTANDSAKNVGANVLYFNGPLSLAAFYQDVKAANPGGTVPLGKSFVGTGLTASNQKLWSLSGAYDLGVVKLFANYAETSHNISLEDKLYSLSASVPAGPGKVMAGWTEVKRSGAAFTDRKRDIMSVGYDYNLDKDTDVYAIYMRDKVTALSAGNSFGTGVRYRF